MQRCADCGFLSLVEKFTHNLRHADARYRTKLELVGEGEGHTVEKRPACFRAAYDIYNQAASENDADVLDVLNRNRDECPKYYRYVPGFSPKEHMEMLYNEPMLEKQEQRLVEDRRWRDQQAEITSNRHREQMEQDRQQHRSNIWFLGVFLALATLLAPIIGALIASYITAK